MNVWLFLGLWIYGAAVSPFARNDAEIPPVRVAIWLLLPAASAMIASVLS